MLSDANQFVQTVTKLHRETVERWHDQEIDNLYDGLLHTVCQQHQFNFLLWHEEDIARSKHVTDTRIAQVKRAIDGYNQQRNDWIERIDDQLLAMLTNCDISMNPGASLNTETPGSAIDRLSIMSLRIYHMHEQLDRTDTDEQHRQSVRAKLDLCYEQHMDLSSSLADLLTDIFAGSKQLKLYRQMKMYNDPTLNPHLYGQPLKKAG
ncbi:MAG: DUF4254 domain-containing protein [Planctomycetales bacterium]|nr:DUF4254 domain-containing protein [Planctomycetales bacterium]